MIYHLTRWKRLETSTKNHNTVDQRRRPTPTCVRISVDQVAPRIVMFTQDPAIEYLLYQCLSSSEMAVARQFVCHDLGHWRMSHQRKRSVLSPYISRRAATPHQIPTTITTVATSTFTVSSYHRLQTKLFSNSTVYALLTFVTQYTGAYIWQWQRGKTLSFDDRSQCWPPSNIILHLIAEAMKLLTPSAMSLFLLPTRKFMREKLNMFRVVYYLQGSW